MFEHGKRITMLSIIVLFFSGSFQAAIVACTVYSLVVTVAELSWLWLLQNGTSGFGTVMATVISDPRYFDLDVSEYHDA